MMAAVDEMNDKNIRSIFDGAFKRFNSLGQNFESTSGDLFQSEIKKLKQILEDVTRIVSSLGLFSSNEDIEEVPTNDIRFFLLPALLGSLLIKSNSEDRLGLLQTALVYFKDFLRRCHEYGISSIDPKYLEKETEESKESTTTTFPDLISMAKQRENKIKRHKAIKEMESNLEHYQKLVENEHADDEVKRKYFLTLVNWWIYQTVDELDCIQREKVLLERFAGKMPSTNSTQIKKPHSQPLKPIIITKNELQKKVYGLGYPSIPTLTVDEFYEQKVRDGTFSVPDMSLQTNGFDRKELDERDAVEKEQEQERDDEAALKKGRDWDDWKDDNRRGWGNRKNKG